MTRDWQNACCVLAPSARDTGAPNEYDASTMWGAFFGGLVLGGIAGLMFAPPTIPRGMSRKEKVRLGLYD